MSRSLRALLLAPLAALSAACSGSPPADPPPLTCTIAPPKPPSSHLHTDGTALKDALGRVVVLRGVNAGGRSKFAPFAPFDFTGSDYDQRLAAYLDRAASWGINALRVPFTWEAVEPTEGMDDEAFLKRYDALLDAAWARGLYTIVDFHQDVYAQNFCGDGFPPWTIPDPKPAPHHDCPSWGSEYLFDKNVQAAFDAFWAPGSMVRARYEAMWDRMIARHKDRPGVIGFEVINEPAWGTADQETWEATTLTDFYSAMADRVHKAAPEALFFFDTTGTDAVTQVTTLARPKGDGLVFAPHYYQFQVLGGGMGSDFSVQPSLLKWKAYGDTWSVPVLIGEFGVTNVSPEPAAFLRAHFAALDALGMSGTTWEYSVASELWNSEDLSLCRADGTENESAGAIIRPFPRAVAGSGGSFSFDADARTAELSYAPASGVTEISVPARAYPSGFDVAIQGGCFDRSDPTRLLVQADAGASKVVVQLKPR